MTEDNKVDRIGGGVTLLKGQLVKCDLRTCSALVLHEKTAHIAATTVRLVLPVVILKAASLVDHFQMVGHLKCTVKWCI